MTVPGQQVNATVAQPSHSKLLRVAIWVAIGALIAAAVVCVVWVLMDSADDIIGRAFLTILLLVGFSGAAILDAYLAPKRAEWLVLTSMILWVVALLIGAFLIWMPAGDFGYGVGRLFSFIVIVGILQLGLLHIRLYMKACQRYSTLFTRIVGGITMALVVVLALMLIFPLMLHEFLDFEEWYWRLVVAITILAAVGTMVIPLINVLFAPKKQQPTYAAVASPYAPTAWPTYADGLTPLPVLPDGNPDWNAYYTGYPTNVAQAVTPGAAPPVFDPAQVPAPAQPEAPVPTAQAAVQAPPAGEWPAPTAPSAPTEWQPTQLNWQPPAPAPTTPETPANYEAFPPPPPLPPQK